MTVLAHQGGWDEMLLVIGPILAIIGLLRLAKKRSAGQPPATPGRSPATPGTGDVPGDIAGHAPIDGSDIG